MMLSSKNSWRNTPKNVFITGGDLMETYSSILVEQSRSKIYLHLKNYIWGTLDEYKKFQRKLIRLKLIPI
jgi:hypothetical protein